MEIKYTVSQNVPGYPPALVKTGLSHGEAKDLAEMWRAASPECEVHVTAEDGRRKKDGRRG